MKCPQLRRTSRTAYFAGSPDSFAAELQGLHHERVILQTHPLRDVAHRPAPSVAWAAGIFTEELASLQIRLTEDAGPFRFIGHFGAADFRSRRAFSVPPSLLPGFNDLPLGWSDVGEVIRRGQLGEALHLVGGDCRPCGEVVDRAIRFWRQWLDYGRTHGVLRTDLSNRDLADWLHTVDASIILRRNIPRRGRAHA